jgi:hypothetical protein
MYAGIYTQLQNIPRSFIFFLIGKSNSKTEGITGWLQTVAFRNTTSCNLIGECHESSCCETPKSYFTRLSEIYEHIITILTPSILPEISEVQFTQTPSRRRSIAQIPYHRQGGGWRQN